MKKSLALIFSAFFLASGSATTVLAANKIAPKAVHQTLMQQANQMYLARRYSEAANLFYQAIVKEHAGPDAWLNMAHCQYQLGLRKEALASYQRVQDNFPTLAEGKTAAMYIMRINSAYPSRPEIKAHPSGTPVGTISSTAGSGCTTGSINSLGGGSAILKRVIVQKPIMTHPEVTQLTIDTVKGDLMKLPRVVQSTLLANNINICITTTLIDRNPELANREGRGYEGATYKQCPGMFDRPTVVICERTVNEATNECEPVIIPGEISSTLYHEIGHALDACLGKYSHGNDYRHAYYLDIARMPPDVAGRLAYFMQKSLAGQEESCGEITGILLGGTSQNAEEIRAHFPLTIAFISKKIGLEGMAREIKANQ